VDGLAKLFDFLRSRVALLLDYPNPSDFLRTYLKQVLSYDSIHQASDFELDVVVDSGARLVVEVLCHDFLRSRDDEKPHAQGRASSFAGLGQGEKAILRCFQKSNSAFRRLYAMLGRLVSQARKEAAPNWAALFC